MKQSIEAEVVVLDRMMYLLEERSVRYLTAKDTKFQQFVQDIYAQLNDHSRQLRSVD